MRASALLLLLLTGCSSAARSPHGPISVDPIRSELSQDQQATHVLARLAFGARPNDARLVQEMGVERWIAAQLSPETIPDATAEALVASYRTSAVETRALAASYREVQAARREQQKGMTAAGDSGSRREARQQALSANPELRDAARMLQQSVPELASAKLARAVVSERQLYEHMVDFWENHFSVFAGKAQTRLFVPAYDRDVIRPLALGKFRDLLGGVARSPAMLFYLDNWRSAADSSHRTFASGRRPAGRRAPQASAQPRGLNENYARELMELHTLGVDGGYTQNDVVNVARALTGWSIDMREGAFVFRPAIHDADEKTVLGVRLAKGRGIEDGEAVLDILARHPSTAQHITRKLAVRFVSDTAPEALVDRCAKEFTRTDGDIRRTLRCVITSPEFFSQAAFRSKVKTPFELVASALRASNGVPDSTSRSAQIVTRLGQPTFGRQTPDGWPDRAEEWLNSGAMISRVNFTLAVTARRVPGVRFGAAEPEIAAMLTAPEFQRR